MAAITGKVEALSPYGLLTAPATVFENPGQSKSSQSKPVGIYVIQQGCLRYADHCLAHILGYDDPRMLIGRSFWELVHPEDRARVRLAKGGVPVRCLKSDGSVQWVRMSGVNLRFGAKPANVGCMMVMGLAPWTSSSREYSISRPPGRKREKGNRYQNPETQFMATKSRLETLLSSVRDGVVTVDHQLKVVYANNAARTLCGLPVEKLKGAAFPQCHPHGGKLCRDILSQALAENAIIREERVQCRARHLRQRLDVSATPIRDANGCPVGAALVVRDVTLLSSLERELQNRFSIHAIIGQSEAMREVRRLVENLADLETTVLISGESGSGKEFIARELHFSGRRGAKPFISINCTAMAENLLERELFGYARGAFKGALEDTCGRFQAADGGTLFLDEIGDLSPLLQLKLLRVLQEKSLERLGESMSRKVDVRVIASTQKDLKRMVKVGAFREDLHHLLKLVEVVLPPLRERMEDVSVLVDNLRRRFSSRFNYASEDFPNEVLHRLMAYHWPGNVRELEYVIERLLLLSQRVGISIENLPPEIRDLECPAGGAVIIPVNACEGARDVLEALSRAYWNRTKAADLLGVSRQTLYRKIRAYKIFENI